MSDRTDRLKENLSHLDDEGTDLVLEVAEKIKTEREAGANTPSEGANTGGDTPPETPLT